MDRKKNVSEKVSGKQYEKNYLRRSFIVNEIKNINKKMLESAGAAFCE